MMRLPFSLAFTLSVELASSACTSGGLPTANCNPAAPPTNWQSCTRSDPATRNGACYTNSPPYSNANSKQADMMANDYGSVRRNLDIDGGVGVCCRKRDMISNQAVQKKDWATINKAAADRKNYNPNAGWCEQFGTGCKPTKCNWDCTGGSGSHTTMSCVSTLKPGGQPCTAPKNPMTAASAALMKMFVVDMYKSGMKVEKAANGSVTFVERDNMAQVTFLVKTLGDTVGWMGTPLTVMQLFADVLVWFANQPVEAHLTLWNIEQALDSVRTGINTVQVILTPVFSPAAQVFSRMKTAVAQLENAANQNRRTIEQVAKQASDILGIYKDKFEKYSSVLSKISLAVDVLDLTSVTWQGLEGFIRSDPCYGCIAEGNKMAAPLASFLRCAVNFVDKLYDNTLGPIITGMKSIAEALEAQIRQALDAFMAVFTTFLKPLEEKLLEIKAMLDAMNEAFATLCLDPLGNGEICVADALDFAADVLEQFEEALKAIRMPCPGHIINPTLGDCISGFVDLPLFPELPSVDFSLFTNLFQFDAVTNWLDEINLFDTVMASMPNITFYNGIDLFDLPNFNLAWMEQFACNLVKGSLQLIQFSEWQDCPASEVHQGDATATCTPPPREDAYKVLLQLKLSFPKAQVPLMISAFQDGFENEAETCQPSWPRKAIEDGLNSLLPATGATIELENIQTSIDATPAPPIGRRLQTSWSTPTETVERELMTKRAPRRLSGNVDCGGRLTGVGGVPPALDRPAESCAACMALNTPDVTNQCGNDRGAKSTDCYPSVDGTKCYASIYRIVGNVYCGRGRETDLGNQQNGIWDPRCAKLAMEFGQNQYIMSHGNDCLLIPNTDDNCGGEATEEGYHYSFYQIRPCGTFVDAESCPTEVAGVDPSPDAACKWEGGVCISNGIPMDDVYVLATVTTKEEAKMTEVQTNVLKIANKNSDGTNNAYYVEASKTQVETDLKAAFEVHDNAFWLGTSPAVAEQQEGKWLLTGREEVLAPSASTCPDGSAKPNWPSWCIGTPAMMEAECGAFPATTRPADGGNFWDVRSGDLSPTPVPPPPPGSSPSPNNSSNTSRPGPTPVPPPPGSSPSSSSNTSRPGIANSAALWSISSPVVLVTVAVVMFSFCKD